jgi:hydrogenase nickel incorporation protein HypA/HybF
MHEWALVEKIVSAASRIAREKGLRKVTRVEIKIGELYQAELDALRFALSQLKQKEFKNTEFNIQVVRTKMKCNACNHEWSFNKSKLNDEILESIHISPQLIHTYVKCPECGSSDFEITHGRGIWIESIKGMK